MGSVVISIDAELGWGFHDLPDPPYERVEFARRGWIHLHELCNQYEIPATWAVVGHLLLPDCDGVHESHPSLPNWFERERTEWQMRPDLRFGGDLVRALQSSSVEHDIGSHSFSHVIFDDERLTDEIVRAELQAAIDAAKPYGIEYDSFVFPRNAIGYRTILSEFEFSVYRSKQSRAPGLLRNVEKLATTAVPKRMELSTPVIDEYGMVDVPPSLFLFSFEGAARHSLETVGIDPIVRQATGAIDRTLREDGVFHMWLHPNNLITDSDISRIRAIFEYIDKQRSNGLRIETLADIADRIQ